MIAFVERVNPSSLHLIDRLISIYSSYVRILNKKIASLRTTHRATVGLFTIVLIDSLCNFPLIQHHFGNDRDRLIFLLLGK